MHHRVLLERRLLLIAVVVVDTCCCRGDIAVCWIDWRARLFGDEHKAAGILEWKRRRLETVGRPHHEVDLLAFAAHKVRPEGLGRLIGADRFDHFPVGLGRSGRRSRRGR